MLSSIGPSIDQETQLGAVHVLSNFPQLFCSFVFRRAPLLGRQMLMKSLFVFITISPNLPIFFLWIYDFQYIMEVLKVGELYLGVEMSLDKDEYGLKTLLMCILKIKDNLAKSSYPMLENEKKWMVFQSVNLENGLTLNLYLFVKYSVTRVEYE